MCVSDKCDAPNVTYVLNFFLAALVTLFIELLPSVFIHVHRCLHS